MGNYSIKELEKLSGIKAHTIRIWEKRYHLIEPQRTPSNIRFYSDDDLKKIINVSMLNANGFKISVIAGMTSDELTKKVFELSLSENLATVHVDKLVTTMIDLDEEKFNFELDLLEKRLGFEKTVTEIIYPFLEKIGILWQTGSITPAHEHFISNLIRQKIIVSIAALPVPSKTTIRVLLFLPENELHEIGLLFYHYLARKNGFKTYYLGQSVPHSDLKEVYKIHRPHFLLTSLTSVPPPQQLDGYLKMVCDDFPSSRVLASGALLRKTSFRYPGNLTVFQNAAQLQDILLRLK